MKQLLKRLLDGIGDVFSESVTHKVTLASQVTQHAIFMQYQTMAQRGGPLPSVWETGYRVFSQTDEDGILVFIFAVIGIKRGIFVDIGGADGRSGSNCANLAINFGWHGLFIDGSRREVEKGRKYYAAHPDTWAYPPKFVCARITRENVDEVIREAGFEGEVDLLSIDIDGNDYWVWDAITCIRPKVVLVETHIEFGFRSIVVATCQDIAYNNF